MNNLKRNNSALLKILTVFLLTAIVVGSAIALNANADSVDSRAFASPSMALLDVRTETSDSITAFNSSSNLIFTVAYNSPQKDDSIVIDFDEKVFARNEDITLGSPISANVIFARDGRKMEIKASRAQAKRGYFQVMVPFVYNQLETRLSHESQFLSTSLTFNSNDGRTFDVPISVERALYDLNSTVHNPYLKISPEKLYYTADGHFRVTMNTFYNYGNVKFEDGRPVRVSNDWAKDVFYLDRASMKVFNVNTPIDENGKMVTSPNEYHEQSEIWRYGSPSNTKSPLQADFDFANKYAFAMTSGKRNVYYGDYAGGFKGSEVTATDSLLIKYDLMPYKKYWNEATDLYTINGTVAGSLIEPYVSGTPTKTYLELKSVTNFKYPLTAFGRDSDSPF